MFGRTLYAILYPVTISYPIMSKKILISPEDQALFRKEMQDVTPLTTKKPKLTTANRPPLPIVKRQRDLFEDLAPKVKLWEDLSDYYANPVQAESMLSYQRSGIGRAQIQALNTGNIIYQAKLDLHGLKPDAAKEQLNQFLIRQIQQQHRWVLVIHGKGGRFGETPVLKNLVNHWLQQIPTVLAFHSAQPKHGGTGSVYVLLKNIDNY